MPTPQPTSLIRRLLVASLVLGGSPAWGSPPAEEPRGPSSPLDSLVGAWVFSRDGFTARQECKWILDRQFLEIDTRVAIPGRPPFAWRSLIRYDRATNRYQHWKFTDAGASTVASGDWNEQTSTLTLSGRLPSGNESITKFQIIDARSMKLSVTEVLSAEQRAVVGFTLRRDSPQESQPPPKCCGGP